MWIQKKFRNIHLIATGMHLLLFASKLKISTKRFILILVIFVCFFYEFLPSIFFSFITHNLIHNLSEVFVFISKYGSIVFCSQKHFSILANMFTIFTSNKTLQRKSNFESFLPSKHKDCIPLFDMCA